MKKIAVIILFCLCSITPGIAQEWMTNLDVAKRLARVQNKMLFVMWEESTYYEFPVIFNDEKGITYYSDLFEDETVNAAVWEYFVPVILHESTYFDLFEEIEGKRSDKYVKKFQDDGIKIMDTNGYILNTGYFSYEPFDIAAFIVRYGLNTTFLKAQLSNYFQKRNFNTSLALGSKYQDFAVLVDKKIRKEIIGLSAIYMNEALLLLEQESVDNSEGYRQRIELLALKGDLILNKPRKVLRTLKKMEEASINTLNESLFAFLHYTAYNLLEDETEADLWESKVSLVDLKKAEMITNINR